MSKGNTTFEKKYLFSYVERILILKKLPIMKYTRKSGQSNHIFVIINLNKGIHLYPVLFINCLTRMPIRRKRCKAGEKDFFLTNNTRERHFFRKTPVMMMVVWIACCAPFIKGVVLWIWCVCIYNEPSFSVYIYIILAEKHSN